MSLTSILIAMRVDAVNSTMVDAAVTTIDLVQSQSVKQHVLTGNQHRQVKVNCEGNFMKIIYRKRFHSLNFTIFFNTQRRGVCS